MEKFEMESNRLTVIGCDGTNTNSGHEGGAIRLLELKLQKPFAVEYLPTPLQ